MPGTGYTKGKAPKEVVTETLAKVHALLAFEKAG